MSADLDRMIAIVDGVDHLAKEMELKWGVGRLRLLVDDDLRTRFDRQTHHWGEACQTYTLMNIQTHGDAMRRAWVALDKAATDSGAKPLEPIVWEVRLEDGTVVRICRTTTDVHRLAVEAKDDTRQLELWSLEEVARFMANQKETRKVKQAFPGSIVTSIRTPLKSTDPNDEIPF